MKNLRRPLRKSRVMLLLCTAAPLLFGADRAVEIAKATVNANYGKLPLSFEENRGQTDRRVKFLSQGQGYSMFLTSSAVVLSLQSQVSPTQPGRHAMVVTSGKIP